MSKKVCILGLAIVLGMLFVAATTALAAGPLDRIVLYQGEEAGTGTGINGFKLGVGDTMFVTAKGVDVDGNDVPIWPTWKCDREMTITAKEGRSKTAIITGIKVGEPVFFSAVYITDDGKKVVGEAMGKVK